MERFRTNVDVVDRIYSLARDYLSGDAEALRRIPPLFARDAELLPSSALASGSVGPYRGAEGMLEWLEAVRAQWASFDIHVDELIDVPPDRVLAVGHSSAGNADGRGYAGAMGQVWELRNCRVIAVTSFQNQARAFEHAGIEPSSSAGRPPSEQP